MKKRLFFAAFSLIILSFFAIQTSAHSVNLSGNIAYQVVALTPDVEPDYWTKNNSQSFSNLKQELDSASKTWSSISDKKVIISYEYFISNRLNNLDHCDYSKDWNLASLVLKEKGLASNSHLIVVNPLDKCENSGYALTNGRKISIKNISATVIAHEIGHNLGFQHSAYVICDKNDFRNLNKMCKIKQYGDKTDVMGAGFARENSKLSSAQKNIVWGHPRAQNVTTGVFEIKDLSVQKSKNLLRLKTRDGYLLIEFDDGSSNGGYKVSQYDKPGIQIRIVGNSIIKKFLDSKEGGIGTLLLMRQVGIDLNGNCADECHLDSRFHQDSKIALPNSNYVLQVLKTSNSSATVRIKGNL